MTQEQDDNREPNEQLIETSLNKTSQQDLNYSELSLEELLEKLKNNIQTENVLDSSKTVEIIKSSFYKKLNALKAQHKSDFLEKGGQEEEYSYTHPIEEVFKINYSKFRKRKAQFREQIELDFAKNLSLKTAIINDIETLIDNEETIKETFEKFRELQNKWRNTGEVGIGYRNDIWKSYHHQVERFYDYIKINDELRDLDFTKNLEQKTLLSEQAEALINETSLNKIHNELQRLHQLWKEIGPVKRELREEVWNRFKNASHELHKKRNQHFLELKKRGEQSIKNKNEICQQIKALTEKEAKSHNDWINLSSELKKLENQWKQQAPLNKTDNKIAWRNLREALSNFYHHKNEFYKNQKQENKSLLDQKIKLCIKVESIIKSNQKTWKERTDAIINVQEEWKKIGFLPKSQSEKVWQRFKNSVDQFFENKKIFYKELDKEKEHNLVLKETLLEKVKNYTLNKHIEENLKTLDNFQKEWNAIKIIPKKNSAIENHFRTAINTIYKSLKIDKKELENIQFNQKIEQLRHHSDSIVIDKEKDYLRKKINDLQKEINQYQTNISFFGNSQAADKLKDQVNKKIDKGQSDIQALKEKLKLINSL